MKKINYLTALVFTGLLVSCGGSEETDEVENTDNTVETIETNTIETVVQTVEDLDNETFQKYLTEKGGVLIDLRTPEEVAEGAIDGAVNMDFNAGDFEKALDTLDVNVPTFVYCQGGGRSGQARDMLKDKGFVEVYNLTNGYGNWDK